MSASKSSSSNYYYSSSEGSSSSESSMGTLELASDYFETIHDLDVGIHIVYNPHTISTYNNTHRYIPTTIRETPVYAHSPKKNYKDINAVGWDPGHPAFQERQPGPFDMLISTDVLEHIEPVFLDNVLKDIYETFSKNAFLIIATSPATATTA